MFEENISRPSKHFSILRKACPVCGSTAQAEAQLPISAGINPTEVDLDRPHRLDAQMSMGQLLALVELIPYKQFHCASCGHDFKLASQIAKGLVLEMVGSMQPVAPPAKKGAPKTKPKAPKKTLPLEPAHSSADEGWEPESVEPG